MTKFQKLPVVIDAILYDGNNLSEVLDFTGKHPKWYEWFASFEAYEAHVKADRGIFKILTLEGTMDANPGDWIIRGGKGGHYPCKPDIFQATYAPVTKKTAGMSFGDALAALKAGAKVARRGWNGKGMWVALTPGSAFLAQHAKCGHAAAKRADELGDPEAQIELLPHIDMRAADGSIVVGWLASQTDMLAEDWEVVL